MDIGKLMKQAQQMQKKMAAVQEELALKEVCATVGGGQVTVVMNGKHELKSLEIKPEAVDPQDIEFLQDMVLSAVNEATRKVDEMVETEMGSVTGGMNIPGMNLPGMGG
ncbi:MAG: YbaB/EbfC family nucleoid-associated protein [bacterium]